MKGLMTPRARVLAAIEHREPDRVPLDFLATAELMQSTEAYLGLEARSDPCFPHWLAPHEALLQRLQIDVRFVAPRYIGPELPTFEEGSFMDVWGFRRWSPTTGWASITSSSIPGWLMPRPSRRWTPIPGLIRIGGTTR